MFSRLLISGDDLKRKEREFEPGLPLKPGIRRIRAMADGFGNILGALFILVIYILIDTAYISTGAWGEPWLLVRPMLTVTLRRACYFIFCANVNKLSKAVPPGDVRCQERIMMFKKNTFWILYGTNAILMASGLANCRDWREVGN